MSSGGRCTGAGPPAGRGKATSMRSSCLARTRGRRRNDRGRAQPWPCCEGRGHASMTSRQARTWSPCGRTTVVRARGPRLASLVDRRNVLPHGRRPAIIQLSSHTSDFNRTARRGRARVGSRVRARVDERNSCEPASGCVTRSNAPCRSMRFYARSDGRISAVRRRDRSRVRARRSRPGHVRRSPCPSTRRTSPCPS